MSTKNIIKSTGPRSVDFRYHLESIIQPFDKQRIEAHLDSEITKAVEPMDIVAYSGSDERGSNKLPSENSSLNSELCAHKSFHQRERSDRPFINRDARERQNYDKRDHQRQIQDRRTHHNYDNEHRGHYRDVSASESGASGPNRNSRGYFLSNLNKGDRKAPGGCDLQDTKSNTWNPDSSGPQPMEIQPDGIKSSYGFDTRDDDRRAHTHKTNISGFSADKYSNSGFSTESRHSHHSRFDRDNNRRNWNDRSRNDFSQRFPDSRDSQYDDNLSISTNKSYGSSRRSDGDSYSYHRKYDHSGRNNQRDDDRFNKSFTTGETSRRGYSNTQRGSHSSNSTFLESRDSGYQKDRWSGTRGFSGRENTGNFGEKDTKSERKDTKKDDKSFDKWFD